MAGPIWTMKQAEQENSGTLVWDDDWSSIYLACNTYTVVYCAVYERIWNAGT